MTLTAMQPITLQRTDLRSRRSASAPLTFGQRVDEATAHAILDHALGRGVNFIDTAEMYLVPARRDLRRDRDHHHRPLVREPGPRAREWCSATKAAGPSRGMPWVHDGSRNLTAGRSGAP